MREEEESRGERMKREDEERGGQSSLQSYGRSQHNYLSIQKGRGD